MADDQQNAPEHTEPKLALRSTGSGITIASFVPTRADLEASRYNPDPADWPEVDFVTFDVAEQTITMSPLRTRPSFSFMKRKYPWLASISVEVSGLVAPTTEDEAQSELYRLPEGFIYRWDWGLGLQKINKPILDALRGVKGIKSVRFAKGGVTGANEVEYRINLDDFDQLVWDMSRVTKVHQQDGLKERRIISFNKLVADQDETVRRAAKPYRRDALSELLDRPKAEVAFSAKDQRSIIRAIGERAPDLARTQPAVLARLHAEIEVVTLGVLIERFEAMLDRPTSEADWQKLFETHPFILSMIFGYPVVLQTGQATVGGPGVKGAGEKIADFLVTHRLTANCALLEIKRPDTRLFLKDKDRGMPKVAPELTSAIVQVLDQRQRFQLDFISIKYKSRDVEMEPHHIGCVVLAGKMPASDDEKRAFEIYRNAFKDVLILTFDEVLERLKALKAHLTPSPDEPMVPEPPSPPSYTGYMRPPWGSDDDVPF